MIRTLCIVPKSPWPPDNGGRQRLMALLRAIESLGDLDLVVTAPLADHEVRALREQFPRARVLGLTTLRRHRFGRLRWLTRRELPFALGLRNHAAARDELRRFAARSPEPYDAVWCAGADTMYSFGKVVRGVPVAVDFADVTWVLHDQSRRAAAGRSGTSMAGTRLATRAKRWVRFSIDGYRWMLFERVQATRAHLVTVCSASDRELLGVPGTVVVPNGYTRPAAPAGGHGADGADPVVLFAGQMTYEPNVDAAGWFAREVLPAIRAELPGVTLAVVGRAAPEVEALGELDGVEVRGYVDDITTVLAEADAIVVPLRHGSGTRIKILEAFAHHVPVVSTSIGAEGLDVHHGEELLVADGAAALAVAVVRVLTEPSLRDGLVARAAARYDGDYDWAGIGARFAARFADVVASATTYDVLLGDRASRRDTGAPR